LNIFKERKFNKEDFDVLSEIKNQFGSGMKFESRDFDFNEFLILEMFKPFLNRKFGIWSKGSKFKPMALNQGHFKIQGNDLNLKSRFGLMDLTSIYLIEFKERFLMVLDQILSGLGSIGIFSKYF
jgi:hypothetical protein